MNWNSVFTFVKKIPRGRVITYGQLANAANTDSYKTQFNLDSDRAYGYLTWDWIRDTKAPKAQSDMGFTFPPPVQWPQGSPNWSGLHGPAKKLWLEYVDKPGQPPAGAAARIRNLGRLTNVGANQAGRAKASAKRAPARRVKAGAKK